MADRQHARQLRAALSYRHKVKRLGRENDEARRDARIDEERHENLRTFYNAHGLRAEAAIAKVRNLLFNEQSQLVARIAAYEQERDALSVRAAAGEVNTNSARQRHRKLTSDIERIRERLGQLETLLNAHEPMALGGFIDMPLDEYTIEPPPAPSRSTLALRWGTAAVALATAMLVFMPWFGAEGGRWPLHALPQFLSAVYGGLGVGALSSNLWIIAFALPLFACPFAAMARPRLAGQGTATAGAVTVLAVIACTLVGALTVTGSSLIATLEPAFFAYLFGALAVTLLGTVRSKLKPVDVVSVRQCLPAIICAALASFLAVAGTFTGMSGGRLLAQVDSTDVDRGVVRLYLGREGHSPLTVHVPWPPDASFRSDNRSVGSNLGVELYARTAGSADFRFVPDSVPYWDLGSLTPGEGNAVTVSPGTRTQAALDLRQLRAAGIDAEALRIDITSARGDLHESVVVSLPGEFRAPSPTIANQPAPQPSVAEPAPTPPPVVPTTPEPAPMPVTPEVAVEEVQETYLTFTSQYGGGGRTTAVFTYSDESGDSRLNVEPGQTIVGAWYLDRLESRPSRAVLKHRGTNEERILHRREFTTFNEDDL